MKSTLAKIVLVAVAMALAVAFIGWWNWRLYAWFLDNGLGRTTAWMLVWGPFVVVGLWVGWLLLRRWREAR